MVEIKQRDLPSSARRHFLGISAALVGRIAALPIIASASKPAKAATVVTSCFLKGTRILSSRGEVPVEKLAIGDLIETLNGLQPVKWIGRRKYKKVVSSSWHASIAPIRVTSFSLDDQYPLRDLYLSPGHCLFIDGVLIPVEYLVNGRSIAVMDESVAVTYFHIELDSHEVIFAEGAPVETLLGSGREVFSNFIEYERLYGGTERSAMKPFAPILGYRGGREELEGLLRLAFSPLIDVRDPIQRARDRIAARAELVDG
jgi:Hint domain